MWLTEHVKDALLTSSGVALGVNVHRDSCGISEIRDLELRMIGAEADERLRGSVEVLAQEYLDHAVRSGVRQRVRQRVRPVVAGDPTLRWRDRVEEVDLQYRPTVDRGGGLLAALGRLGDVFGAPGEYVPPKS